MGPGWRFTNAFRAGFVLSLAGMTVLSIVPLPVTPLLPSDKTSHVLAYFTLAFMADFAFSTLPFFRWKALPLFAYGALVELVQSAVPGRYAEWWDMAANAAGLLLFWVSVPLWKKMPLLRERWTTSSPPATGER